MRHRDREHAGTLGPEPQLGSTLFGFLIKSRWAFFQMPTAVSSTTPMQTQFGGLW